MTKYVALIAAIFGFAITPLRAGEAWQCEYRAEHMGQIVSLFHVEGSQLVQNSGDVIVNYQLLENSDVAIVAAKGGSYASAPKVMGFLVMIEKDTGEFVFTTDSVGPETVSSRGKCVLTTKSSSN